jgi:hypothetical protein
MNLDGYSDTSSDFVAVTRPVGLVGCSDWKGQAVRFTPSLAMRYVSDETTHILGQSAPKKIVPKFVTYLQQTTPQNSNIIPLPFPVLHFTSTRPGWLNRPNNPQTW